MSVLRRVADAFLRLLFFIATFLDVVVISALGIWFIEPHIPTWEETTAPRSMALAAAILVSQYLIIFFERGYATGMEVLTARAGVRSTLAMGLPTWRDHESCIMVRAHHGPFHNVRSVITAVRHCVPCRHGVQVPSRINL